MVKETTQSENGRPLRVSHFLIVFYFQEIVSLRYVLNKLRWVYNASATGYFDGKKTSFIIYATWEQLSGQLEILKN